MRSGQYEDASRWTHRDYDTDSYGNRTLVQDELEQSTTTCYDGWFHAFSLKSTNALEQSSSAFYHGVPGGSCAVADGPLTFGPGRFGLLEHSQDANGVSTTYTYDDLGRVTGVVEPPNDGANPTRTFTYRASAGIGPNQPFWVQEAVRDDGGETNYRATYTSYDGFGRILQRSTEAPRAVGGQVQYIESRNAYNWRDAKRYASVPAYVLAESDGSTVYHPVTNWTTLPHTGYEYDAHGRLSKTIAPDLTAERTYYSVTATSETRLLTAAIDAKDHMTIHESDPFGRLVTAKQFAGEFTGEPGWGAPAYATAIYAYNVADRLESVTGPATPATRIYYDGLGRKERMEDVDLGVWRYSYKATGALETQTNAEACVTTFSYDDVGRLTGKSYSGPQKCATAAVSFAYDEGLNGIGRRTAMRDGSGSTTWRYDVRGRVIAETRNISDTAFSTYRSYGSDNSLETLTYPDGEEVTYGYDAGGRVTSLNGTAYEGSGQPADYLAGAAYTALGQPANLQYGNGAVVGYTYYPDDFRLATITAPGVSLSYGYDPAGNVQTITDTLQTTAVTTFGYDELNRLKSAGGAYSADYTYSPNGNLLMKNEGGSSTDLTYPAAGHAHAPASVNGVNYAYDNNGNVTSDGRRTMAYDAENRLSRVISGTLTTIFAYDGDGNLAVRVAPDGTKTLYISSAFEVTVSTAAPPPPPTPSPRPGHKVYLPWVSSSALSCSTLIEGHTVQIRKHYLLGQQRIAQRDACNGATTVFFYHDLLGSTAATSAGESARYWPYGDARSGGLNSTDYHFTGQRNDGSTSLYLMGVRWYDPDLGRWIQPDTIVPDPLNPQSLNRYSFASNNPLRYVDKNGHCGPLTPVCLALLLGGMVFLLQGDSPDLNVTPEDVASQRLGGALFVGGAGLTGATALAGIGGASSAGTTAATAACADGDCTNEAATVSQGLRQAGQATSNAAQSVWRMNPWQRGAEIETRLGGRSPQLPYNFPGIDRFENGVATSIKSIDLGANSYQNMATLTNQIQGYVNDLAGWQGARWAGVTITSSQITARELLLAIPAGASQAQLAALQQLQAWAQTLSVPVAVNIVVVP